MTSEQSIRAQIDELVATEHRLRQKEQQGGLDAPDEHEALRAAEVELDRLWDLLRQRRARIDAGQNPDDTEERGGSTVEGYLQ